jgi:hypothetical protein
MGKGLFRSPLFMIKHVLMAIAQNMLKAAFWSFNCKNWEAIAALVPGRTVKQCTNRGYEAVDLRVDLQVSRKDR